MRSTLVRHLVTAIALVAGALLVAMPAQAAQQREAPAPATTNVAKGDPTASLWRFRYDCGTRTSKRACNEVRAHYGYAGWAISRLYYRPPGCTAPGVICPTYYFYYGRA